MRENLETELKTTQWYSIIDTLKSKKTIVLTFTGGEVFIRKDFIDIYKYAYDKNFKINIFTNASLMSPRDIEILSLYKPLVISITLYGSSNKMYTNFTKNKRAFNSVLKNINMLKNNGINVNLKAIANTVNKSELIDMKEFAASLNIPFHTYFKIISYNNGDGSPKKLQLCAEEAFSYFEKLNMRSDFLAFSEKKKNDKQCSAGNNQVFIDPNGCMFLCNNSFENKWSVIDYGFDYCWEKMKNERKKEIEIETPCSLCPKKNICSLCAPLIKYEYKKLCKPIDDCIFALKFKSLFEKNEMELKNVAKKY
jgi:MoaA/NifB/PqqE/SkfB family radical SAM enzyme